MYTIKTKDGKEIKCVELTLSDTWLVFRENFSVPAMSMSFLGVDEIIVSKKLPIRQQTQLEYLSDLEDEQIKDLEEQKRNRSSWDCDPTSNWPKSPYGY